jgi:hypothetical protein
MGTSWARIILSDGTIIAAITFNYEIQAGRSDS